MKAVARVKIKTARNQDYIGEVGVVDGYVFDQQSGQVYAIVFVRDFIIKVKIENLETL